MAQHLSLRGFLAFTAIDMLFDPATILDVADFVDPCRPAQGIEMVFTNGVCTWKDGNSTGTTPGRALRRS